MSRNQIARAVAMVLVGILCGLYVRHDYVKWSELGRDAFLAYDAQRFDLYMAHPRPLFLTIFGSLIAVIGFFGLYELLVLVFSAILKPVLGTNEQTSRVANL